MSNENTQRGNGFSPYKATYPALAVWWVSVI